MLWRSQLAEQPHHPQVLLAILSSYDADDNLLSTVRGVWRGVEPRNPDCAGRGQREWGLSGPRFQVVSSSSSSSELERREGSLQLCKSSVRSDKTWLARQGYCKGSERSDQILGMLKRGYRE